MSPDTNESHAAASKSILFVLLITCLVYVQVVTFPFLHFDDTVYIVENGYVHKWQSLPSFFTGARETVAGDKAPPVANLYRPIPAVWLLLNYKLFGVHPALWHLSALSLYFLGVWLLWRVAWKLTRNDFVAAAASLFYALHPTHVEGVAWVSGASVETLLSVLFLGAFLAYLHWREVGGWLWLAACEILTLLALFTKETAVALPVLMLTHAYLVRSPDSTATDHRRNLLPLAITSTAVVGTYALLRVHALHTMVASQPQHSWGDVFRTLPLAFVTYLQHAFWPVHLAPWYDVRIVTAAGLTSFYLPLAVCLACAALTLWAMVRKPLIGFFLLWWIVSLAAPLIGIIAFPEFAVVQDRLSFVAIAGLAMLAAQLLANLPNRKGHLLFGFNAIGTVTMLAVALGLGMLSVFQVRVWNSDFAMLSHAIEVTPMSQRARVLLGAEYMKHGEARRAVIAYRNAVNLDPNQGGVLYPYAIALASAGDRPEAIRVLTRATQVSPLMTSPYFVLADLLVKEGRFDEAAAVLERGARQASQPALLRWQLSQIRLMQQQATRK